MFSVFGSVVSLMVSATLIWLFTTEAAVFVHGVGRGDPRSPRVDHEPHLGVRIGRVRRVARGINHPHPGQREGRPHVVARAHLAVRAPVHARRVGQDGRQSRRQHARVRPIDAVGHAEAALGVGQCRAGDQVRRPCRYDAVSAGSSR